MSMTDPAVSDLPYENLPLRRVSGTGLTLERRVIFLITYDNYRSCTSDSFRAFITAGYQLRRIR